MQTTVDNQVWVLAGTYTAGKSEGIYVFRFDPVTGALSQVGQCPVDNPSYLVRSRKGRVIYSVTENEHNPSFANAFSFDPVKGELVFVNRQLTGSEGPCFLAIDPREKFVVTANYAGGSISVFPIEKDGSLKSCSQEISFSGKGVHPVRQEASHPHCVIFSEDMKYLFVTDLGTDTIYRFCVNYSEDALFLDENSRKDFSVKPGSGPRHLVFDAAGNFLYVVNELNGKVLVFRYDEGDLILLQEISIDDLSKEGAGGIIISPDGKLVFVSMREGNDSIAIFKIQADGMLLHHAYYKVSEHPRDLAVSPDGNYLLVSAMKENEIMVLKIIGEDYLQSISKPVSIDQPAYVGFM